MSKKPTDLGHNRSGIATSPLEAKRAIEGASEGVPDDTVSQEAAALENMRLDYSRKAEPLGSIPPPATVKGKAKTAMHLLKGERPTVFIDMLGARLGFERTGVRLYEALLVKLEASHSKTGGPTRAELEKIRDDELRHFHMLEGIMEKLGADPTALTPSANTQALSSEGIVKVLAEPGTTLTQALQAILTVELADNDAWDMLVDLAEELGHKDMVEQFEQALLDEEEHLQQVRGWLRQALHAQAAGSSAQAEMHNL